MDPNSVVQNLLPIQSEDLNYNEVYENLIQLYTTPLDLNTCTRDDLASTYLLNERQLNSFFTYREQLGKLVSIYELQAIPTFDLPTIYKILPFVTVIPENKLLWNDLTNPTDHYILIRTEQSLEQKRGFTNDVPISRDGVPQRFEGSSTQWYARYRYSKSRNFSLGFTIEKDEGEAFRWQPSQHRYGPDFISFHAQIQNRGRIKNLVFGDYQLQIGQGLIFSAGFSLGKGMETVYTIRRPTTGARPYSSVTESGFFRGTSITYTLNKRLQLTALYSRVRRSGSVSISNDLTGEEVISTLQTDGLHRIPNELAIRANVVEQNAGAHLLYKFARGEIGGTMLYTHFSQPLQRAVAVRNEYEFTGIQNLLTGVHGNYLWHNYNLFAEVARSQSGGVGAVAGLLASISKRWDATFLFRHFDKSFHSFYSNAFSESSRNSNETGVYIGGKYTIHKKLKAGAYVDGYRFPWFRYLVDKKPTYGYDFLVQGTWTPNKKWAFYAIYRQEQKEHNIASKLSKQKFVTNTNRHQLILNTEYNASKIWSFRTRLQGSTFAYKDFKVDKGWMMIQEINADFGKISALLRCSIFNTDSYDSRQYAVERDVLYAVSMPAYYDYGFRNFLLIRYTPHTRTDIWVRFARTDMPNQKTLSSYVDEIDASHRSELKLQVRHRF
ncbi:helix-hairpin-helix domain-containing protein [Runella aurantiaca]|uniref:Helix-hairpin-helix domain-containing protein n=1 Tax=Runella aurantiaca TaxID=2282308 RepID=A0A369I4J1_9BACT|nr:helix-hairpin-helix domain-containing protein [Runella aurantiaca]